MRHPHERPARNVHGFEKAVPSNVYHAPVKRLFWGIRDRVEEKIELTPLRLDALEHPLGVTLGIHIQRHKDGRLKLLRQWPDMFLCPVVQIRHRQVVLPAPAPPWRIPARWIGHWLFPPRVPCVPSEPLCCPEIQESS